MCHPDTQVLILPGLGNSGPDHWQSRWEKANPGFRRVMQRDWDNPVCAQWRAALEQSVGAAGATTVLVAHSLGCLLVAHWAARTSLRIKGALLVGVPDPSRPTFPPQISGFHPVPQPRLPFDSIVVASSNDPYGSLEHAERCAMSWGSRLVNIGDAGHINVTSGFGDWSEGYRLLQELMA